MYVGPEHRDSFALNFEQRCHRGESHCVAATSSHSPTRFPRILVHDYCGHPFQVQLSRELARRGHSVFHLHFADFETPKGNLARQINDPPTFDVKGISLGKPFLKNSLVRRWRQERLYQRRLLDAVRVFAPNLVLSANTPLGIQWALLTTCRRRSIPFIPWVQDLYSIAVERILAKRLGWAVGVTAGCYYRQLERSILNDSDQLIYIADDFMDYTSHWKVGHGKCHVIENWAPLDELPPRLRDNEWSRRHHLSGKTCLLYSGTLGRKHNPGLLLALAEAFRDDDTVVLVTIAEGPGRVWLEAQRNARRLANLVILDLQPYEALPEVLASGDILVALIEQDAGTFAVPSKVLTYLCAQRPLLLAVPQENSRGPHSKAC